MIILEAVCVFPFRLTMDDAAFILDRGNDLLFLRFSGDKGVRTGNR